MAMGAGRKAASSMKKYLGIYQEDSNTKAERLFGIPVYEHNFARLRAA
jgi:hypothetical protein